MKENSNASIRIARSYGRKRLEEIIRALEERDLKDTTPYLQFKQLLVYLNSIIDDYQI